MNRQTYLDDLSCAYVGAESLQLARMKMTADDVKDATVRLEADVSRHRIFARLANFAITYGFFLVAGVPLACGFLNTFFGEPIPLVVAALGPLFAMLGVVYFLSSEVCAQESRVLMLQALQPIAGSTACEDALKLVQSGHPQVLAWRDLAIEERGQLHHFDVDIMRGRERVITEAQEAAKAAENRRALAVERKRRLDEACRIVHGI